MFVSILGDSISTYEGYIPVGYDAYYEVWNCMRNGLKTVDDTWWKRVLDYFGWELCVNNSFSGSRVSGLTFPSANVDTRAKQLHKKDKMPDIILIYIGFNDFGFGAKNRPRRIREEKDAAYFFDAYRLMLEKIKETYPNAKVICATLLEGYCCDDKTWTMPQILYGEETFSSYNDSIRLACRRENVSLVDLNATNIRYETLDGTHPTVTGHEQLAKVWIEHLEKVL